MPGNCWEYRSGSSGAFGIATKRTGGGAAGPAARQAVAKKVPAVERSRILKLYRETYRGWNVKHFHERLTRDHGFRWGFCEGGMRVHIRRSKTD
jgi:hypothetical protein